MIFILGRRLLQTSLSGNARIAIVCTISPDPCHGIESLSTLKFASRASKVQTRAERGAVVDASAMKLVLMQRDIDALQRQLAERQQQDLKSIHGSLESERKKVHLIRVS